MLGWTPALVRLSAVMGVPMATREAYEEWIDEVAIEVSCDDAWRDRLFSSPLGEELYVGCERPGEVPEYVRDAVVENGLSFLVATAPLEGDEYDVGMVSFAFWSREHPNIVTRTGKRMPVAKAAEMAATLVSTGVQGLASRQKAQVRSPAARQGV